MVVNALVLGIHDEPVGVDRVEVLEDEYVAVVLDLGPDARAVVGGDGCQTVVSAASVKRVVGELDDVAGPATVAAAAAADLTTAAVRGGAAPHRVRIAGLDDRRVVDVVTAHGPPEPKTNHQTAHEGLIRT
jgi:hypothetical protein